MVTGATEDMDLHTALFIGNETDLAAEGTREERKEA